MCVIKPITATEGGYFIGGVGVMGRARRKAKGPVSDEQILDTFIQSYYDLGLMTYGFVKEILVGRGLPPRGLIDLLGITSSEVRQNIKQKLELMSNKKDQDQTEFRELLKALRVSMEISSRNDDK